MALFACGQGVGIMGPVGLHGTGAKNSYLAGGFNAYWQLKIVLLFIKEHKKEKNITKKQHARICAV